MPAVRGFTPSPGILGGVEMIRSQDSRGSRLYFHELNIFMQRAILESKADLITLGR